MSAALVMSAPLSSLLHAPSKRKAKTKSASIFNFISFILHLTFLHIIGSSSFIIYHLTTRDRKSTRLNSSHVSTSYAVFCLKKKILTLGKRQDQIGGTALDH